jgi:uncharacterized membrane protein YdfJ with MMPL/SSD domain
MRTPLAIASASSTLCLPLLLRARLRGSDEWGVSSNGALASARAWLLLLTSAVLLLPAAMLVLPVAARRSSSASDCCAALSGD